MVRASAIGKRTFSVGSGQEKVFWSTFEDESHVHIDKILYHASRDPIGGLRDTEGSY